MQTCEFVICLITVLCYSNGTVIIKRWSHSTNDIVGLYKIRPIHRLDILHNNVTLPLAHRYYAG